MAEELLDICDENNILLGIQKLRSETHRTGKWHRAAHVWIYNSKGEVLLQLRSKEKIFYPNKWDVSSAGHISAGEDPLVSALRELKEEIGLDIAKEDLIFWKIQKYQSVFKELKNNEFDYVYFFQFNGDISRLKLQKEEVQEIRFFNIEELKEEIISNPDNYLCQNNSWEDVFNEIQKRLR